MSVQQPVFPETLDEILNVVKETPRGRWFLEAYSNRVQSSGTTNILAAISKLENNLNAMSGNNADAAVLQRARDHIAKARADIASSQSGTNGITAEGRLFAKLADLSRKAFNEPSAEQPAIAENIERALRLVADLDQDLNDTVVTMPVAAPKPAFQYFKQDDDIFEPAPAAATIKPIKASKPVEATPRGAKLVIQHVDLNGAKLTRPETQIDQEPLFTQPPMNSSSEKEETPSVTTEPPRIVIIRRKAEEMAEVPLAEEQAIETVSAA